MSISHITVGLFAILYFGFVVWTRRKADFSEFAVAGRGLGVFLIFATISASYIGPAMTMGLARDGYEHGIMLIYIATIGGLGMVLVSLFVAPVIRRRFTSSYSIGDIIGGADGHAHRSVRIAVGVISTWLMGSIAIAMSYAGGELINHVFGISKFWSIALMTAVVILYSFFGGIRATIQTDAFQFVNFIILVPILAFLIYTDPDFVWQDFTAYSAAKTTSAFDAQTASGIFGLVIFWLVSTAGLDAPMVSRYLSTRSPRVARIATLMAGLFLSMWVIIMVFIGSAGAYAYPELLNNDQILLHIAEYYFSDWVYGIFIVAMIGVVMSTQDSALNTASISFSQDVLGGLNENLSDHKKLVYAKSATIIIGLLAVAIAGYLQSILHVIIVIFSFYMPVMIPVTLFSVFKRSYHWLSALVAMAAGFIGYFIWYWLQIPLIPATLGGMMISTIGYLLTDYTMSRR